MKIYYTRYYDQDKSRDHGSRKLLRRVLIQYCGLDDGIAIYTGKKGRRYIDPCYGIWFSVTHTGHLWICSVSSRKNGIDAERMARKTTGPEKLAKRFMTEEEQQFIKSGRDEADTGRRLIYLWTRKEAYLKVTGEGLYGLRNAPSVLSAPEGMFLTTKVRKDTYLSICAEGEEDPAHFEWFDMDRKL